VDKWFAELPARKALILSLEPARAPAQKAIDTLNKAAADGIADLHRVVAKAEDRPELEPIDIKVEIKASEPANTVFDSSDDFITATRKLQRSRRWPRKTMTASLGLDARRSVRLAEEWTRRPSVRSRS
jgi:hypothetical protein